MSERTNTSASGSVLHRRFRVRVRVRVRPVQTVWPATTAPVVSGGRVQGCAVEGYNDVQGLQQCKGQGSQHDQEASVAVVERKMKLKDITGTPCRGRQGLGTTHFQQWGKADPRQRRLPIQTEVRHGGGGAKGKGSRARTTKWPGPSGTCHDTKITWEELWRPEPFCIPFLLGSVCDTLPAPTQLHRWVTTHLHGVGSVERGPHPGRVPACPEPGKTWMVPQQVLQNTGRHVGAAKMEKTSHPPKGRQGGALFTQLSPGSPQVVQTSLTPDRVRGRKTTQYEDLVQQHCKTVKSTS